MAELYRLFKGLLEGLDKIPKKRGYIYFCIDTGNLYVDTKSDTTTVTDGTFIPGERVLVNAGIANAAKYLIDSKGDYIDIDNLLTGDVTMGVTGGGTGRNELEEGGILVGNGTEPIESITGTGFLISDEKGIRFEEVLPIEMGGTGSTSLEEILANLNVYNQLEIDIMVRLITQTVNNDLENAVKHLENRIDGKLDIVTGTANQLAGFDSSGNLIAKDITLVNTFKGRSGAVVPQAGDYNASMVGARANTWMPTAKDVGARPDNWIPTAAEVGAATMALVNEAILKAVLDSWAASY